MTAEVDWGTLRNSTIRQFVGRPLEQLGVLGDLPVAKSFAPGDSNLPAGAVYANAVFEPNARGDTLWLRVLTLNECGDLVSKERSLDFSSNVPPAQALHQVRTAVHSAMSGAINDHSSNPSPVVLSHPLLLAQAVDAVNRAGWGAAAATESLNVIAKARSLEQDSARMPRFDTSSNQPLPSHCDWIKLLPAIASLPASLRNERLPLVVAWIMREVREMTLYRDGGSTTVPGAVLSLDRLGHASSLIWRCDRRSWLDTRSGIRPIVRLGAAALSARMQNGEQRILRTVVRTPRRRSTDSLIECRSRLSLSVDSVPLGPPLGHPTLRTSRRAPGRCSP